MVTAQEAKEILDEYENNTSISSYQLASESLVQILKDFIEDPKNPYIQKTLREESHQRYFQARKLRGRHTNNRKPITYDEQGFFDTMVENIHRSKFKEGIGIRLQDTKDMSGRFVSEDNNDKLMHLINVLQLPGHIEEEIYSGTDISNVSLYLSEENKLIIKIQKRNAKINTTYPISYTSYKELIFILKKLTPDTMNFSDIFIQ